MSKIHYLNSHTQKFRETKKKLTIDLEQVESLAIAHDNMGSNKKLVKVFMKSFKSKEDYKSFLSKLPKDIHRPILHYLVTAYWIAYVCYYYNDKFPETMGELLERIDENLVLLDSIRFCKKTYYYLNPIEAAI
mgnify:FL=1